MGWACIPRKSDRNSGRFLRACIAELFATFSVVFWGCGAASDAGMVPLTLAFSFGSAIALTAYLFHETSGCHVNPAVSLALFFAQKISLVRCFVYWIMQLLGALLAAALLRLLHGEVVGAVKLTQTHGPDKLPFEEWQGFLLEFFGTLALVYTYLAAGNPYRQTPAASYDLPLALGATYFLTNLVLVSLTGCSLNPARMLMINGFRGEVYHDCWVYIVGPFAASLIGAFSYEMIFSYPLHNARPRVYESEMQTPVTKEEKPQLVFRNEAAMTVEGTNGAICYE